MIQIDSVLWRLRFSLCPLAALNLIFAAEAQRPGRYQLDRDWFIDGTGFDATVTRSDARKEVVLGNGLVRRIFRLAPNAATVGLDNLMTGESVIRALQPEARVTIDGADYAVGGLAGQPNRAWLTQKWIDAAKAIPGALTYVGIATGQPRERLVWKRTRHHAPDAQWPPKGVYLRMDYALPKPADARVRVSVHYELYDGIPLFSKWITVHNGSDEPIEVDRFRAEELSVVEFDNPVNGEDPLALAEPDALHVETDMAFGGFTHRQANRHAIHWRTEPGYLTQINYQRKQRCRLVVEPTYGPDQTLLPGATFESFHVFELIHDSSDRERRGLALRRMYRTIAPWVTENPLMMHLVRSDEASVRGAIDQCADVGFELLILSFGSGFRFESEDPAYRERWKRITDYAHAKGIHIGSYSLLSSRGIEPASDMIKSPEGQKPTHGRCPSLVSGWGQAYFRKLRAMFDATGFDFLEHDGSYPGDVDVTPRPPLQKGMQDSRWVQWRTITDFYKDLRARGVYMNVPDYYYLSGTTKCGMGYRETNWSLPRVQQRIHTRLNIYDGTWEKTPSMGWMFVPLTQYHGGGAAATIEPLDQHLDHYRAMLDSNLGLGVQACYRGPRLYDTERTRALVKERVAWFKEHRDILESDLIHGRRADGRDLDWMVHVNPRLQERAMLVVYNPTDAPLDRELRVPLYYSGLTDRVAIRDPQGKVRNLTLDRGYATRVEVSVPAHGFRWYLVSQP